MPIPVLFLIFCFSRKGTDVYKRQGMDSKHERTDGNSGREHLDGIGIQLVEDTREDGLSKAEEEIASALWDRRAPLRPAEAASRGSNA